MAFSAVSSQNHSTTGYIIPDKVLSNVGDTYNSSSGIFTCPDNALYMFTWGGVAENGSADAFLQLRLNGSIVVDMLQSPTASSETSTETTGSNSQSNIMRCAVGNSVQIYCNRCDTQAELAEYTFLTGYRLPNQV